jgi:prepilin-type N-terminal cleavage/methylation domain-containing protein
MKETVKVMHPDYERADSRGYSLIEVLIAIALLGTVLMSVLSLFVFGRRNVYSGKQMTHAVSTSTRVMEDLSGMSKRAVLMAFGLQNATTGTTNTLFGQTFPNSFVRTTRTISAATDPSGFLARWRGEMVDNNKFQNGVVTIVFTPTADPTVTNQLNAKLTTGTIVKMRVFVSWGEAQRPRQIALDTLKIER